MTNDINDAIEAGLTVPEDVSQELLGYRNAQDSARGDWPSPRESQQPEPPWPHVDNPVLRYLIWKAKASIAAGMSPQVALLQLAVHAWFEGGVENYDRGRQDAESPDCEP